MEINLIEFNGTLFTADTLAILKMEKNDHALVYIGAAHTSGCLLWMNKAGLDPCCFAILCHTHMRGKMIHPMHEQKCLLITKVDPWIQSH